MSAMLPIPPPEVPSLVTFLQGKAPEGGFSIQVFNGPTDDAERLRRSLIDCGVYPTRLTSSSLGAAVSCGTFATALEARVYRDYIRSVGIPDAFTVPLQNSQKTVIDCGTSSPIKFALCAELSGEEQTWLNNCFGTSVAEDLQSNFARFTSSAFRGDTQCSSVVDLCNLIKIMPDRYPSKMEMIAQLADQELVVSGTVSVLSQYASAFYKGELNCLEATVVRCGPLSSHKGLNLPNTSIEIPAMSDKDCADMQFGLENDADMFAISFVKHARDITEARTHMQKLGGELPLIAKIEKHEAVANLEEIVREADGAMVARGDLGVEIPVEQVPLVQKRVIALCNSLGKPVITATQMLDSMIRSPRPTRAEVTDVANAIFDGSDAVMLSGETAVGKFPLHAVEIMNRIAETSEEAVDYEGLLRKTMISQVGSVPDAISHATATIAHDLNLRYIVCLTHYGSTPRMIARYRPHSEILVYALSRRTAQQLCLTWGVRSTSADFLDKAACPTPGDSAAHLKAAIAAFKQQGVLKSGDLVALASGVALHQPGTTNMIEVLRVS